MDDYVKLYKRTWHIQHKIAHLALNLTLLNAGNKIPMPERDRVKRIIDQMWKLALMKIEEPE